MQIKNVTAEYELKNVLYQTIDYIKFHTEAWKGVGYAGGRSASSLFVSDAI